VRWEFATVVFHKFCTLLLSESGFSEFDNINNTIKPSIQEYRNHNYSLLVILH
jgi:hypothetical protein